MKPTVADVPISRPRRLKPRPKPQKSVQASTPSSNWLALQKKIVPTSRSKGKGERRGPPRKKRRLETEVGGTDVVEIRQIIADEASFPRGRACNQTGRPGPVDEGHYVQDALALPDEKRNGESTSYLRRMTLGQLEYTPEQTEPGRFLALDCEMVGVGLEGAESVLARVSIVNYHGAVQLDEFVRPRERVVDYRTEYSGIRESDMVHAKPFLEVQQRVADLLKDKVLIGHAVFNDLKALLLSHPRPMIRDTQQQAGKHKLLNTKYPALRKLVQQELGVTIQDGEHSSVTDARATMALYRLYRKEWDKGWKPLDLLIGGSTKKRKRTGKSNPDDEAESSSGDDESVNVKKQTGKGTGDRKGISSGLSTIIRRRGSDKQLVKPRNGNATTQTKEKWWKTLGTSASKGSLRVQAG